ncbi:MAG: holo-ACP synthase [Desulfurobacteriaceae bacterium]
MAVACGIDIVSVRRIERLFETYGERFLYKVFPEKVDYCFKKRKGELFGCIAARFALKEAVIKAFSQLGKNLTFRDIAIEGGGKGLKVQVKKEKEYRLVYSISHEREFAIAVVNIVRVPPEKGACN